MLVSVGVWVGGRVCCCFVVIFLVYVWVRVAGGVGYV